jgi:small subunit ribosomal protein S8
MYTDPIADMLTRIRNAGRARHASLTMPGSRLKTEIARVLKEEGYIVDYRQLDGPKKGQTTLAIKLKYHNQKHVIEGIKRLSSPGQRKYVGAGDLRPVLNGYGVAVLSTSKGVMTGSKAKAEGLGGELICSVW